MGRITFTAEQQHEDIIGAIEAEDGVESQAAAVRACISRYAELQQRVEDLENEHDEQTNELQSRIAELWRENSSATSSKSGQPNSSGEKPASGRA